MHMKRDRTRKFRLKDGTQVEYQKDRDAQSKKITSPCGGVWQERQLMRAVTLKQAMRNLYCK